ncbi:MAG TPA: tripartite tricarboxylate transporter substrate binding protein [Burkholderiales bacterium]|jgi:tripartite-type tricarboxylate transporter receptor subunit TctC
MNRAASNTRPIFRFGARFSALALAAGLAAVFAGPAGAAAPYPNHAITMIVPYAAGGSADVLGRVIAQEMGKQLGQTVVPDLRPGAGGNLGAEIVAKSSAHDGYTFLFASVSLSTSVSLMKLNFDPRKDLVPVAGLATIPSLLVVSANSPYHSLADLVKAAKEKKGAVSFGSSGLATGSHLSGELLKAASGADMLHVPYKGSGAVYPDLIAQRITFLIDVMGSSIGQVQGGKVRALAITSAHRSKSLPNVPTVAEQGFPGFEFGTWFGFFAPAGTPPDVVHKLETASLAAIKTDAVKERFEAVGAEALPGPAKDFGQWYLQDVERWAKLVREGRIQPIQ